MDRWATTWKQTTQDAKKRHEKNKAALRNFNNIWRIFKALPFADEPPTVSDTTTNDAQGHSKTSQTRTDREI